MFRTSRPAVVVQKWAALGFDCIQRNGSRSCCPPSYTQSRPSIRCDEREAFLDFFTFLQM